MNKSMRLKLAADVGMTILLLALMAYQLTGNFVHEWAGAAMFLLFIAHHILNRRWFASLGKGRWSPLRILQAAVDFLLLASMLGLMVSAVILSRYVFSFLPITGGAAMARRLHLLCSYWGFVLMSLHLGLHWGMVVGMVRKALRLPASKVRATALRVVAGGIALYGAYCFLFRYQLWLYLFRQAEFVLFDAFGRPAILFYVDHVAMMGAFVLLSYGLTRLLQARKRGGASV